jgi:hypothetical protein
VPAQTGAAAPFSVYMGPIRVRAYDMTIVALPKESDSAASVDVFLDRDTGKADPKALGGRQFGQEHSFLVDHGARVRIAATLLSATVRANLGRYGRVDLMVRAPAQDDPDACLPASGTGTARGTVLLRPGGRYFGTIRRRRVAATVYGLGACPSRDRAGPSPAAAAGVRQLTLGAGTTPLSRFGRNTELSWSADELFVSSIRSGRGVFVQDSIEERSPPPSTLAVASDLSSATLRSFGPFLSGTGSYTATSPRRDGRSTGFLSGTMTALFDTPGPLRLSPRPTPAVLGNFGS